jgi:hypothetical protein
MAARARQDKLTVVKDDRSGAAFDASRGRRAPRQV